MHPSQVGAERAVSFDNGPEGSKAEDCFFGMVAMDAGRTFDFIEGEMQEKSPFSFRDFLKQRKRWMQVRGTLFWGGIGGWIS